MAAILAVIVLSELLDDENGDKTVATWVISLAIGAAIYVIAEWARRRQGS